MQLGTVALKGPATFALAAGVFVAVRYFRRDVFWVFLGGLVLWFGAMALGIASV